MIPSCGQLYNFVLWTAYGLSQGDLVCLRLAMRRFANPRPPPPPVPPFRGCDGQAVLRVNSIGCGFSCIYFSLMMVYSRGVQRARVGRLLLLCAAGLVLCIVVPWLAMSAAARTTTLGVLAVTANIVMYASPISGIRIALASADPSLLPVALSLASLCCSALWCAYGIMVLDWFVAVPNISGVLLCVFQIAVVAYLTLRVRADPGLTARTKHAAGQSALLEAVDDDHHEHGSH